MVLINGLLAIFYIVASDIIAKAMPDAPMWLSPVAAVLLIVNVCCAIALFKWKKWGFVGFCTTAAIGAVANVAAGQGFGSLISAVVGVAILYGILHIGGERKGWDQLE